jgi:hypothetical protein
VRSPRELRSYDRTLVNTPATKLVLLRSYAVISAKLVSHFF